MPHWTMSFIARQVKKWDVIVIGAGIAGAALTYALARTGMRVLLLERGKVAGGASGANMGMALWVSARSESDLTWAVQGFQRLATLERELEADFNYRLLPSLVLAPDEAAFTGLQAQAARLSQAGLPAGLVEAAEIADLEPALHPNWLEHGALYGQQGHTDGALLTTAYTQAARRQGAEVWEHVSVSGFEVEQGRVKAVQTTQGTLLAGQVVLAAGAWTRSLAALAGVDLPIYYIQGEALATGSLPPTLRGMVMVARSDGHSALERRVAAALAGGAVVWEQWQNETEAQDVSAVQLRGGPILLGQISRATPSYQSAPRVQVIERIRREAIRLIPALTDAPIQRSWIAPVPFTPDQQPLLGPISGYSNLFGCVGFKSALIMAPPACEMLARQIETLA